MRTLTDLARHLNLRGRSPWPTKLRPPPLALLTDEGRMIDPLPVVAALPPGSLVILRHYAWPERPWLAARLAALCRARRLRFSVAGDIDLAIALGAGLHLPEGLVPGASAKLRLRHRKRPDLLLTAAAHDRRALRRADRLGVDAALLAPVFPTLSHPGKPSLGLLAFRRLVRRTGRDVHVYALGGVTARTISGLIGSGASGVATVGGLPRPPTMTNNNRVITSAGEAIRQRGGGPLDCR